MFRYGESPMLFEKLPIKRLIGITGNARVGKDSAATFLQESYENVWGEAFAKPLKEALSAMYGIPVEHFSEPKFKEEINEYWGRSPRRLAQEFGTEIVRENMGSYFWIWKMYAKLSGAQIRPEIDGEYTEEDTVLITDVRFQNEYDWLVRNDGILLEIKRPGYTGAVGIPGHSSEAGFTIRSDLENHYWNIQNDGNLDSFHRILRVFANSIALQPKEIPDETDSSSSTPIRGISLENL